MRKSALYRTLVSIDTKDGSRAYRANIFTYGRCSAKQIMLAVEQLVNVMALHGFCGVGSTNVKTHKLLPVWGERDDGDVFYDGHADCLNKK